MLRLGLMLICLPLPLALAAAAVASVAAESSSALVVDEAEVVSVRFDRPRGPGGAWFVIEVEVALKTGAQNPTRYVDRPGVAIELGYERPAGGTRRFEFYQAEATAVTIEQGRTVFRFYLPPEVVARDRLTSEARFYSIELTLQGRTLPLKRAQLSASLAHADALANFRARVAAEASANRGVLLPQAMTPFAASAGGPSAPTLIRLH